MASTFVIQNQDGHYWSKQKDWTDGHDRRLVFRTEHKDDAINMVFELSSRDVTLRAHYTACEVDDFGNPLVEASDVPLPMADNNDGTSLETDNEHPHIVSEQG